MNYAKHVAHCAGNSSVRSFIFSFWSLLAFFLIFSSSSLYAQHKLLVVSGGGARGAWGGGVVQNLVKEQGNSYDVVIGTSTGSLMAPLIVKEDFKTLRMMYTSVNNRSIFNVNPFKVSKDGQTASIRGLRAVKRLIMGKKTLGVTKRLRGLIGTTYDPITYRTIQESGGHFIISVANFTNSHTYYFDSRDYYREDDDRYRLMMLDHIWRSSNQPLFMSLDCTDSDEFSLVQSDMNNRPFENGDCWVDAGIRDNIPLMRGIEYALERSDTAATDTIHVVINNVENIDIDDYQNQKILPSLIRTIDVLSYDIRFNDVSIPGELVSRTMRSAMPDPAEMEEFMHGSDDQKYGDIVISYYFMPENIYRVHPQDLNFDEESMDKIWQRGLDFEGLNPRTIKTEVLSKRVAALLLDEAVKQDEIYLTPVVSSKD